MVCRPKGLRLPPLSEAGRISAGGPLLSTAPAAVRCIFSTVASAVERSAGTGMSQANDRPRARSRPRRPQDTQRVPTQRYFHLHLVSDATGGTLLNVGREVAAQYKQTHSIEHIHSLVRTQTHVDKALRDIEQAPGIVLYTLVDSGLSGPLEKGCRELGVPCVSVLEP